MSVSVVIPARLQSSRLPEKVLLDLGGKTILQRVWEQANKMTTAGSVVIAADSERIRTTAEAWGAKVLMTNPDCQSGTERIASIIKELSGKFILNIQGDEPFVDPKLLDNLVECWQQTNCDIVTPVVQIHSAKELHNPNFVKAVLARDGRAIYFSRSSIPYYRDENPDHWHDKHNYWGHIGVYGYKREVLENYNNIPHSPLESIEKLEQLRFIDAGYTIQTVVSTKRSIGIDTQEDLIEARKLLSK
jgi:3-deoxy-manno-octulosonate cytidylyltransferase (CMP-KDO synthetase)